MRRAAHNFWLVLSLSVVSWQVMADPLGVLESLSELPYAERVSAPSEVAVRAHLIPLGAMQKERGAWRPSASERRSGTLYRFTWRALEFVPSLELLETVVESLRDSASLTPLFRCEARACGSSAQWANRIFQERILYGREASQRYEVFLVEAPEAKWVVMLYSSARTSDRQYLHAELLRLAVDQ